jgi:hypothetical protein
LIHEDGRCPPWLAALSQHLPRSYWSGFAS